MAPTGDHDEEDFDPRMYRAIKKAVREEFGPIKIRLDNIEKTLGKRLDDAEEGLQFTSERVDRLMKTSLPAITDHIAQIAESLAQQTLEIDVHRRKWNIIVHGIEGPVAESEEATRGACTTFASEVLKVTDAENIPLAACHRLSRKKDAGIILRFTDLADRDRWMAGTRNLRDYAKQISVSPDLPPVLRTVKDDLMRTRSTMSPDMKTKSKVRYLPKWPFVELRIEGQQARRPNLITKHEITKSILGFDALFKVTESS